MIRILFSFSFFVLLAISVRAAEDKPAVYEIEVEGMVCEFCAQSLEKTLRKKMPMSDLAISAKKGLILVQEIPENPLQPKSVRELLQKAGYPVTAFQEMKEPFSKLKTQLLAPAELEESSSDS